MDPFDNRLGDLTTGWMVPIEPMLGVQQSPGPYAGVPRQLPDRAL